MPSTTSSSDESAGIQISTAKVEAHDLRAIGNGKVPQTVEKYQRPMIEMRKVVPSMFEGFDSSLTKDERHQERVRSASPVKSSDPPRPQDIDREVKKGTPQDLQPQSALQIQVPSELGTNAARAGEHAEQGEDSQSGIIHSSSGEQLNDSLPEEVEKMDIDLNDSHSEATPGWRQKNSVVTPSTSDLPSESDRPASSGSRRSTRSASGS